MQRNSILFDQYATQTNNPMRSSEQFSPLRASVDPRFSNLLMRASIFQERARQQQVYPETYLQSPSTVTANSNAWSPTETPEGKPIINPKKSCLSAAWKTRLQGLLVGLAIAAIAVGITLAVLLTRPSTNSTSTTATTAPPCGSLRWSESGVVVAGNGSYGNASNEFRNPMGIYVDSNYTIYVADQSNHRVQQWLSNAVDATTVAGITGVSGYNNSLLNYPRTVYGDSRQNLYIGDNYGIIVWPIGASVGNRIASSNGIGSIQSIYVDKNGYIYTTSSWNCAVRMWTSTTATSTIVAGGNSCGYASSQLTFSYGLTVDASTNTIYVANTNAHTIVAWPVGASNGTIVAGRNFTSGTLESLLNYPYDIKQDSYGNLYVADSYNDRIMLFCRNPPSISGRIIAGYQLSYPYKMELDSNLNLYVLNNNQVLKYARIS